MIGRYYEPVHHQIREQVFKLAQSEGNLFERRFGLSKEEERDLAQKRAEHAIRTVKPFEMEHFKTDPKRIFTLLESLNNIDFGSTGRCMIHFGLFGASILYFGTEKHKPFLDRIVNDFGPSFFGMFCMSELGHASNVQAIETQAIYRHETKSFEIVTPNKSAVKVWSGGAAKTATWCVLFAKLIIDEKDYGVHTFIVPIRSENDHSLLPNIRIRDLGTKISLNSLDNGRIWFDKVSIPKDYLLDRFGTITDDGKYSTNIPDAGQRFLEHVQALLIGRIMTSSSSLLSLKLALEVTLKYAINRKQFGPTLTEEYPIINYLSYQRRMYPYLAQVIVLNFSVEHLKNMYAKPKKGEDKVIHTIAGCLKAKCSSIAVRGCQECREANGAQGFLAANRIGEMRGIADASTTYEGDNNVLYLTAARQLVRRKSVAKLEKIQNIFNLRQLQKLFEIRECIIEKEYREKLEKLSKIHSHYEAANKCQDLALKLGNAFIENHALKIFICEGLDTLTSENRNIGSLLEVIALLNAITWIQQDLFFLQHQLLDGNQYGQLDEKINSICQELTPLIPTMVKSFGLPKFLTNVPMGANLYDNMDYDKIYN